MLKDIVSTTRMLANPVIQLLGEQFPKRLVKETIKAVLQELRDTVLAAPADQPAAIDLSAGSVACEVARRVRAKSRPGLGPAINATGIILHTGLGRAPLADTARDALARAVENYCTLEIDVASGRRGSRHAHVEELLRLLTGAEAAIVVNNNAAAVLLVLNTLADQREVLVSRGQLVEIGGSFRMPDVMRLSGAEMIEVGTTNRTHLADYEKAIAERTALVQTVHPSNYRIRGFTSEVPLAELKPLCDSRTLPLVHDIGSGCLLDFTGYGLPPEPVVVQSIRDGADVVTFSGDKLLGGPQCGIAVGRKKYVDMLKNNPLSRALRCDKMVYAALEATLKLFLDEKVLFDQLPVLRMAAAGVEELEQRAKKFIEAVRPEAGDSIKLEIIDGESQMGSGAMPACGIPTRLVAIGGERVSADELARRLRLGDPPVFGRIAEDRYLLDLRTVHPRETDTLAGLVGGALKNCRSKPVKSADGNHPARPGRNSPG
ncbi:MAG: L-seryl-tRNA(Sec) selenium transferase [Candidatus Glassbacteria bacterium]|nr:L-seryl-tRNA(Sec) selenium transferase [Candidatus Glassbacteria bacterium]